MLNAAVGVNNDGGATMAIIIISLGRDTKTEGPVRSAVRSAESAVAGCYRKEPFLHG
jgi:hypothetical protein